MEKEKLDMQTLKIVEAARELLKSYGYFVDNLWHVEDVHLICEQQSLPRLTDQDAMEVFAIANDQFDGEAGISWPQLEHALHAYYRRRDSMRRLHEAEQKTC